VAPEQDDHQVDQWFGKPGESSALFESDLAYFKPSWNCFVGSVQHRGRGLFLPGSVAVGGCGDGNGVRRPTLDIAQFRCSKSPSNRRAKSDLLERSFGGWDRSDTNR